MKDRSPRSSENRRQTEVDERKDDSRDDEKRFDGANDENCSNSSGGPLKGSSLTRKTRRIPVNVSRNFGHECIRLTRANERSAEKRFRILKTKGEHNQRVDEVEKQSRERDVRLPSGGCSIKPSSCETEAEEVRKILIEELE